MPDILPPRAPRLERIIAGYYKVYQGPGYGFANIHRQGREWHADLRNARGELTQYAGIWPTLRDALEEVLFLLPHQVS